MAVVLFDDGDTSKVVNQHDGRTKFFEFLNPSNGKYNLCFSDRNLNMQRKK